MSFEHLQSIYRNYDIRGQYPIEINEEEVAKIGRALATMFNLKRVAVGYDIRPSAMPLKSSLTSALLECGVAVVDIGVVTTPMSYFVCMRDDIDMTIMITASHMPSEFNGLKICIEDTKPLTAENLQRLKELVAKNACPINSEKGELKTYDPKLDWIKYLTAKNLGTTFSGTLVVDPANMVGGVEIDTLRQVLPSATITAIYDEFDHTTPNHEANPIKLETLGDLGSEVVKVGAALGVAFDGDADRVGVVDETGTPIPADIIGALIAREMLHKFPDSTVVLDLRSSDTVLDEVKSAGGTPVEWKVGHTNIRHKMRETNAILGIELAGHFFFKETNYSEGGVLPLLYLLEHLERLDKPLSVLVDEITNYFHSGEINSTITLPADEIYKRIKTAFPKAVVNEIDGLTLRAETWWCNIRPSANDPVMRLNVEAVTQEEMAEIRDELLSHIRAEK